MHDSPDPAKISRILGIVFLILGAGNIAFGTFKYEEHKGLLKAAQTRKEERAEARRIRQIPILNHKLPADGQFQRREWIRSKVEFYKLVVVGGKACLSIGLILLVAPSILTLKLRTGRESADNGP